MPLQYEAMFSKYENIQKTEKAYLQYLYDNFGSYTLDGSALVFRNDEATKQYYKLAQDAFDARRDADNIDEKATKKLDADINQLK